MEVKAERAVLSRFGVLLALLLALGCLSATVLFGADRAYADDNGQTVWATVYEKDGEYTLAVQKTQAQESTYGSMKEQKQVTLPQSGWKAWEIARETSVWEPQRVVFVGGIEAPSSMMNFFFGATYLKAVDFRGLDTSKVTSMESLFDGCTSLESIDLSPLDTSRVTDMRAMFDYCYSLTSLDLSPLDTSKVTRTMGMFANCRNLTSLDLSFLDLSKVSKYDICHMADGTNNLKNVTVGVGDRISNSRMICPLGAPLSVVSDNPAVVRIAVGEKSSEEDVSPAFAIEALKEGTAWLKMSGDSWNYDLNIIVKEATSKPSVSTSLSNASVTVKDRAWTGKKLTPSSVTVKVNGKTLKKGTDYTITCKGGKAVGAYKVTVKGKGSYTGSKTAEFKIVPKTVAGAKAKSAKKSFKVTWKKPAKAARAQVTGYQVRYSTAKSMKAAKTVKVKGSAKTSAVIKKLKGGKKYYVQVRAYKTVKGKTYYSTWSPVKSVKTKK